MTNKLSQIHNSISSSRWLRLFWLMAALISLLIAVWSGRDMMIRNVNHELWGHRPLIVLFWSYMSISFTWLGLRKIQKGRSAIFLLASLVGILMGLSFPPLPFLLLILIAWMGLLVMLERLQGHSFAYRFRVLFHVFILWNIIATYWISNTAFAAGIAAIVTNSLLMTCPMLLYAALKSRFKPRWHFLIFAAAWIAFEFFHFRWEAHWPWLCLGHYFMEWPSLIQWYEWTGVLGGTLWVLSLTWIAYSWWNGPKRRSRSMQFLFILIVPMVISLLIGQRDIEKLDAISVAIVQPNYEPHYVKGKIATMEEIRHFLSLSNRVVSEDTDYLIYPETSFRVRLNRWNESKVINSLMNYLHAHPNVTLISGLESSKILDNNEVHDEYTRTYIRGRDTIYWENHNSAVCLSSLLTHELYYKSKLVPGAEFFPFRKALFFLKPLMDKLGGSASGLRKQKDRVAFVGMDGSQVAPVICYESVYGEYVSEYMDAGAEWIAVMTNDGWWDVTAGHQQHLGLSVLRAIEQRKWVARSANSGISCFIDPYGNIKSPTVYARADAVHGQVYPNRLRTLYSRVGDMIGRLAALFLAGLILFSLVNRIYRNPPPDKES